MPAPLISICIPAYNRIEYLKNLLNSIARQNFRDFEVVISDDSNTDAVKALAMEYTNKFPLRYYHNPSPAGTPENWNMAIAHARGEWIKLMHDDDAFTHDYSLKAFADGAKQHPEASFIFSGYYNVNESGSFEQDYPAALTYQSVLKHPALLLAGNIIGPPSVVMHKRFDHIRYDKNLKWLVDIDFYIRALKETGVHFIKERLINIGINPQQVTRQSSGKPEVEIPEFFLVYQKLSTPEKKHILIFDAAWRLIRNMGVKNTDDIRKAGWEGDIPAEIRRIISFQKNIPQKVLKIGTVSKSLMSICYLSGK